MKIVPIPPRAPNSKPNATFVKLLKEGLDKLWNGRSGQKSKGYKKFICNTFFARSGCGSLELLIAERLGDHDTFQDWAGKQGRFTMIEIQDGRRRWMLDMIEEFS
jgi:hypothetical protein